MSDIETRCWINGRFVQGTGSAFILYNPATEEEVCEITCATSQEVNAAVDAANAAQPAWAAKSSEERAACLLNWADLLEANANKLNKLDSISMGQPVAETARQVGVAASKMRYAAGLANAVAGDATLLTAGKVCISMRQPFGVTAGIIPWNVPLIMLAMKAGPALAAGNAIVIKTSEKSPLSGAFAAGLSKQAGFPDGVLAVVTGAADTGRLLCEHKDIRKISFTGSTRTGRAVAIAAAQSNLKEVSLELGGKSPALVFADADLDKAASSLAFSLLWNSGQICMATTRVYVHESVAAAFKQKYATAMGAYSQGDPLDPTTALGPLADSHQMRTVQAFLDNAPEGKRPFIRGPPVNRKGYFVSPAVYEDLDEKSDIVTREIFGPVGVVNTFSTEEEAVRLANDTEAGLYASLFTRDISRALRVTKLLEAGHVAVNGASPSGSNDMPLTGWKTSGTGVGDGGLEDVKHWTAVKSVIIDVE